MLSYTWTNFLATSIVAAMVSLAVWFTWRRARPLGFILLAGLFIRAVSGFSLFWISARHFAILPDLQLGDGFWVLALDARGYFNAARVAALEGLSTISDASASPLYVKTLALFIRACGATPLSALVLNLLAYSCSVVLAATLWKDSISSSARLALLVLVAGLTFSPALLLTSTQALKDQLFVLCIIVFVLSLRLIYRFTTASTDRPPISYVLVGTTGAIAAIYAISGMRAYYAMILILAGTVVLLAITLTLPV